MDNSVALVVKDLSDNSLGRAYALTLVLDKIGVSWEVLSAKGGTVWEPLRGSAFAEKCVGLDDDLLLAKLQGFTAVIACKPLPETLGLCLRTDLAAQRRLLLDVDDPDIENLLRPRNWRWLVAAMRRDRGYLISLLKCAVVARNLPVIVSNPQLKSKYGGLIIPHVRKLTTVSEGDLTLSDRPTVLFLGTVRRHKGLGVLRRAVNLVNQHGPRVDLVVTDSPPAQHPKWEKWIGTQGFSSRATLLSQASLVVITVWDEPHRSMQLPAKAIDALCAGVPIVRNDTPVLRWACESSGYVLKSASIPALADSIIKVLDDPTAGLPNLTARARLLRRFDPATYATSLSRMLFTR